MRQCNWVNTAKKNGRDMGVYCVRIKSGKMKNKGQVNDYIQPTNKKSRHNSFGVFQVIKNEG